MGLIDTVFDIRAGFLPAAHAAILWREVARVLPWIEEEYSAGILPLKGGQFLSKRAKLALRIPAHRAEDALRLAGCEFDVEGNPFQVGAGRIREIAAYPTLHAHFVASEIEERAFLEQSMQELSSLDIRCRLICGMRQELDTGEGTLSGYSLVSHDLKPESSIRLQHAGLGKMRRFGCGIFVPHKTIAGLED